MANSEIRVGRVSSVNYETGMARVTYRDRDDSVTAEFPVLNNNDEYRMPQIGQDVLVAHLSNGSSRGAVIGTMWNQKFMPHEAGETLYRKDMSRKKDAAFTRYSDETGEYLVKAANVHVNGVNRTILDGPHVEIAANLSIIIEAEQVRADLSELTVTGGEAGAVTASVKADVRIEQEENSLQAALLKMTIEAAEEIMAAAGTSLTASADDKMEAAAGTQMKLTAGQDLTLDAAGELRMSDGSYSVTLREIMERLEALEG